MQRKPIKGDKVAAAQTVCYGFRKGDTGVVTTSKPHVYRGVEYFMVRLTSGSAKGQRLRFTAKELGR
jgi:hypothetical protein